MSAARPSDGLLPAASTIALIDLLAARSDGAPIEHVVRDLAASTPVSWSRARNTITKLVAYGVIRLADRATVAISSDAPGNWHTWIAERIAMELSSILTQGEAWSCLKLDTVTGGLIIDAMTLPPLPDGLGMWVTDFGVANRTVVEARFWHVAKAYRSVLLASIRDANLRRPRRAKTAERLAAELARQAEAGADAELWVLNFERFRLSGHPLLDQIRRVSVDDVSAGYDILSFASHTSLQHDLFIEVKSHGATKLFHWSRNEIATASEFGENYALYLVDRMRCGDPDYAPHIITAPTPEMFGRPDSGWRVEPTSFEHIEVRD